MRVRTMFSRIASILFLLSFSNCAPAAESKVPELHADVVVYGDASVGVAAAVQAARMGKSVILVSQYGHLGGLTSSGLGYTDIGNRKILGGISREFYHRVYLHYQNKKAWVQQKKEEFPKERPGCSGLR